MQEELGRAGLAPIFVVPRARDAPFSGINRVRQRFPTFRFRDGACERGLEALSNYHWKSTSKTATVRSEPEHDWSSHYADAMRVWAEADMNGMLSGKVGRSGGGDDDDWFMRGKRKRTAPVLRGFGRRLLRR